MQALQPYNRPKVLEMKKRVRVVTVVSCKSCKFYNSYNLHGLQLLHSIRNGLSLPPISSQYPKITI